MRICEICGKDAQYGHAISHAHNVTKRRWNVNLQRVKVNMNGTHKYIRICTRCLRSNKVQKVVS